MADGIDDIMTGCPSVQRPDSPEVIAALTNPDYYDELVAGFQQSPLQANDLFKAETSGGTCGAPSVCPAWEGKIEKINGRKYRLFCINAPWGTYFWLPAAKSLEECEASCHNKPSYDCNGLTFYPNTGACTIIYSKDSRPYIWDNGTPKIGAIALTNQPLASTFVPGTICPLPASDNQVWHYGPTNESPFKVSCLNAFKVPASAKKNKGYVDDLDACANPCAEDKGCFGFHYYQPSFPGGWADGKRMCEHIVEEVGEGMWAPVYKPNQALAGLKVGSKACGEEGWDQDKGCKRG
ncbi:MAG: hypothetical protein Q9168_007094 [Polycauliona sp. 1 TL-2023]